ncbi:MAG: tRNA-dihydrouridine synthase [Arsenophonus sp. NC-PE1-MAG3]
MLVFLFIANGDIIDPLNTRTVLNYTGSDDLMID